MEPSPPPAGFAFADDPPYRRPIAWVTWTIIASTVGVFLLQLLELHRHHEDIVGNALAFSPEALMHHRYYTLLTYAWAHAVDMGGNSSYFWLHIVTNMIPLACIGPALEEILGHLRYLGLYLGGAIFSVLVWYFFNIDSDEPIIGASGAVFAVIAGIGMALPRQRVTLLLFYVLPIRMSLSAVAVTACAVEAGFIIMQYIPALAPWYLPEIAHVAHLGGAAFGAFYTWLMLPPSRD